MFSPNATSNPSTVTDELTKAELGIFVSVLVEPLIDLFENVTELLRVTSGAAHCNPDAVPELAVSTCPFVPTDKSIGVEALEALISDPLEVKKAVPIVSMLFICS